MQLFKRADNFIPRKPDRANLSGNPNMDQQQTIRFSLSLSYEQYAKFYRGLAKNISVIADDGRRIEFPAGKIQPFLTELGIHGYFELKLSVENKFLSLKKLR